MGLKPYTSMPCNKYPFLYLHAFKPRAALLPSNPQSLHPPDPCHLNTPHPRVSEPDAMPPPYTGTRAFSDLGSPSSRARLGGSCWYNMASTQPGQEWRMVWQRKWSPREPFGKVQTCSLRQPHCPVSDQATVLLFRPAPLCHPNLSMRVALGLWLSATKRRNSIHWMQPFKVGTGMISSKTECRQWQLRASEFLGSMCPLLLASYASAKPQRAELSLQGGGGENAIMWGDVAKQYPCRALILLWQHVRRSSQLRDITKTSGTGQVLWYFFWGGECKIWTVEDHWHMLLPSDKTQVYISMLPKLCL